MAEVRKIFRTNDEQQQVDVYPITTIDAVLDENGESVRKLIAVSSQDGNALERKSDGLYVSNSGGGGGSSVSINQILKEGTAIADITIDGKKTSLYAPSGSGGGGVSTENPAFTGTMSLNRRADSTIGNYSTALGKDTIASGEGSVASGINIEASSSTYGMSAIMTASGIASHAEGIGTLASGDGSHAEGKSFYYIGRQGPGMCTVTASGEGSHAEGIGTLASGDGSHAEGQGCQSKGEGSHAEGIGTLASAKGAHAEGNVAQFDAGIAGQITLSPTAEGEGSHAEGLGAKATGKGAHAEGGYYSESFGYSVYYSQSIASGNGSHAEGQGCQSKGEGSHAEGIGTIATAAGCHVEGKYNVEDTNGDYLHILGGGTATQRANLHTIDKSGNAWFKGAVSATNIPTFTLDGTTLTITTN